MDILENLDVLLITNPVNIHYITGFIGVDERDAYLLITKSSKYLFVSSLYKEQANQLYNPKKLKIIEFTNKKSLLNELAKLLTTGTNLGFEENDLKVSEYNKIQDDQLNIQLISTQNRIEELRMIKTSDEIKNIRAAAKLTDQCFDYILGEIKPGVTETQLAWKIEAYFKTRGADLAFSPIVAFNTHSSQPHYRPTNYGLSTTNSLVLLDFGARVNGYCADMTRTIFFGKPKDEWIKTYETVLNAQKSAIEYCQSQKIPTGAKADQIARDVITKANYPVYPHSLGHGVGLEIHEEFRLSINNDFTIKPNTVFTIEPGIYLEGNYGIRIEDLVVLTADGLEILSKSPKELIIL